MRFYMKTNRYLNECNEQFWADLCGSWLARRVGADKSPEGLRKYDGAYLDLYPYLLDHVPLNALRGRRTMEIGLGYGTLGTAIMEAGGDYLGVDISPGPIEMMRYRMEAYGLNGAVRQGDFLTMDLPEGPFDAIVSIGCLHHTGSLELAVERLYDLLNPGGTAYVMVYNAFSYRHWITHPLKTLGHGISEMVSGPEASESDTLHRFYDANSEGDGGPFTEFSSIKRVRRLFSRFSSVQCTKENCAEGKIAGIKFADRSTLLPILGRTLGTDIYCRAVQ